MAEVHRQIQVQLEEMVGIPSSEVSLPRRLGTGGAFDCDGLQPAWP